MDDDRYKAARRRVVRRYILRVSFVFNLLLFLLILLLIPSDTSSTATEKLAGTAIFALAYGAFLLLHASAAFNLFGRWVDRAAQQEMDRLPLAEKPKRTRLELNDDGEINEVVEDWPEKAKQGEEV